MGYVEMSLRHWYYEGYGDVHGDYMMVVAA
jgi:hypothetical protein